MANLSKPEPVEKLEDEEYSMPDDDSQQNISKIEPVAEAAAKEVTVEKKDVDSDDDDGYSDESFVENTIPSPKAKPEEQKPT